MTSFIRRFLYYLTGFGIGIILVVFFFQNRGCSWTPTNRAKAMVGERIIVADSAFLQGLKERHISVERVKQLLKDGEINFSESQKRDNPKAYVFYDKQLKMIFTLPKNCFVSQAMLGFGEKKEINNPTSGMADLWIFPKDEKLIYVDSLTNISEEYAKLGKPDRTEILNALKKDGKIDFGKSNLEKKPRPEQYLICTIDGQLIGIRAYWYKDKLNIFAIESINSVSNEEK